MVGLVVVRKQDLEVFSCRWKSGLEIDGVSARDVDFALHLQNQSDLAWRYAAVAGRSGLGGGDGLKRRRVGDEGPS